MKNIIIILIATSMMASAANVFLNGALSENQILNNASSVVFEVDSSPLVGLEVEDTPEILFTSSEDYTSLGLFLISDFVSLTGDGSSLFIAAAGSMSIFPQEDINGIRTGLNVVEFGLGVEILPPFTSGLESSINSFDWANAHSGRTWGVVISGLTPSDAQFLRSGNGGLSFRADTIPEPSSMLLLLLGAFPLLRRKR